MKREIKRSEKNRIQFVSAEREVDYKKTKKVAGSKIRRDINRREKTRNRFATKRKAENKNNKKNQKRY
jgi:hypothetical protein